MSFSQKKHTKSRLSDTSADCEGKFSVKKHFMEFTVSSFVAARFFQLFIKNFGIYSDAH